jgi:hypothetical protein
VWSQLKPLKEPSNAQFPKFLPYRMSKTSYKLSLWQGQDVHAREKFCFQV